MHFFASQKFRLFLDACTVLLSLISAVESSYCLCSHSSFCKTRGGKFHISHAPKDKPCQTGAIYCCKGPPGSSSEQGGGGVDLATTTSPIQSQTLIDIKNTSVPDEDSRCNCIPRSLCAEADGTRRIENSPLSCSLDYVYCCRPPTAATTLPPPVATNGCSCIKPSSCYVVTGHRVEMPRWGTACPRGTSFCCLKVRPPITQSPYTDSGGISGSNIGCSGPGCVVDAPGFPDSYDTCSCLSRDRCSAAGFTENPLVKIACPSGSIYCCGSTKAVELPGGSKESCSCMSSDDCSAAGFTVSPAKIGCKSSGSVSCCGSTNSNAIANAEDQSSGGAEADPNYSGGDGGDGISGQETAVATAPNANPKNNC